jgi:restriction endonuclease S subunit
MKPTAKPLQDLLKDSHQGLSLYRYQSDRGNYYYLVNLKDLEFLEITGEDLTQVRVNLPKSEYLLEKGDVVISLRGNPLKAAIVDRKLENAILAKPRQCAIAGQNLAVFRPKPELDSLYLAVLLRSQWMQARLAKLYMPSTAIQLIKLSSLRQLEIPLPDLKTQQKLAQLFLKVEETNRIAQQEVKIRQNIAEAILVNAIEK